MKVIISQTKILLRKNYILARRSLRSTLMQIFLPFFLIILLLILEAGINANERNKEIVAIKRDFVEHEIPKIPRCIVGPDRDSCTTVAWTSNDKTSSDPIMDSLVKDQGLDDSDVLFFDSQDKLDDHFFNNPNGTAVGVGFEIVNNSAVTTGNMPGKQVRYSIMYNKTVQYHYGDVVYNSIYILSPVLQAVQRAITKHVIGSDAELNVARAEMARPELVGTDVVATAGPTFFFGALMVSSILQLGQIVYEKENKLREGMRVMGLRDSAYWMSWVITNMLLNFISVWVLVISGCMCQFRFFLRNDFGAYFFLFLLFAWAMVPFVCLMSVFVDKARTATSIGFFLYLIGFIGLAFSPLLFSEDFLKGKYSPISIIRLLPFMLLGKGMDDIGKETSSDAGLGFKWSDRNDNDYFSLADCYAWLVFDFFFALTLAVYCDNVVKGEFGRSRGFLYFLDARYWKGSPSARDPAKARAKMMPPAVESEVLKPLEVTVKSPDGQYLRVAVPVRSGDPEVAEEDSFYESGSAAGDDIAVVIRGLNMTFQKKTLGCFNTGKPFYAVRRMCLRIEKDRLFGLLGHNGAGKSTLVNMLTGLLNPTYGDADVLGYSVVDQMDQIRANLGVCPQHDILFSQLTSREHIEIFAGIKGMDPSLIEREVRERLGEVNLMYVQNVESGAYSGGMRRRLSTAIAFIGNPKVVILDECTTGLDPVARRQVWSFIQSKKPGRAIIMLTHSMEECTVLSDRVGIMGAGRLITLGTVLRLKNEFGTGYIITAVLGENANPQMIVDTVAQQFPGLYPMGSHQPGVLPYTIVKEEERVTRDFIEFLERKGPELGIVDTQVEMSSLEDVFVRVSDMAEGIGAVPPPSAQPAPLPNPHVAQDHPQQQQQQRGYQNDYNHRQYDNDSNGNQYRGDRGGHHGHGGRGNSYPTQQQGSHHPHDVYRATDSGVEMRSMNSNDYTNDDDDYRRGSRREL